MLSLFHMWTYWPAEHTLLSALFIPHESAAGLHPILGVGWTLNMEMYFYSVFALSIRVSRSFAPVISGATISAIWFGLPYLTDNKAACFYFTHPYISYFVIGIVMWYVTEWITAKVSKQTFPRWLFPCSIPMYLVSVLWFDTGMVGVSLLFAVSVIAANQGADIKNRALLLLGNASYACYLLHTIIIEYLRQHGVATSGTIVFTTGVLVGSWALAIVWHFTVERCVLSLRQLTVFQLTKNERPPFAIPKVPSGST
jgi:exopolysaccharide production protein ExoZ